MFFNRIKRTLKQRKEGLLLAFEIMHFFIDLVIVADLVVPHVARIFRSCA